MVYPIKSEITTKKKKNNRAARRSKTRIRSETKIVVNVRPWSFKTSSDRPVTPALHPTEFIIL